MSNPTACTNPDCSAPKEITRSAHLEVLERDSVPRPQFRVMLEHLKPALSVGIDGVGNDEVAIRATVRPTDPPAQLIELRQTEVVGAIHEHRIGVRHVESRFDDHRRHQHVDIAVHERVHAVLELVLAHLAVRHADPRPRNDPLNVIGDRLNCLDAIVDEEHLAAAIELARDPFVDQVRRPTARRT